MNRLASTSFCFVLLGLLPAPAAAQPQPAMPQRSVSRTPSHDLSPALDPEIFTRLEAATAVFVYRVDARATQPCDPRPGAAEDQVLCHRVMSVTPSPGDRWKLHVISLLKSVAPDGHPNSSRDLLPEVAVRFQSDGVFTDVLVSFRQMDILIASTDGPTEVGTFRSTYVNFLKAFAEALPHDAEIGALLAQEERRRRGEVPGQSKPNKLRPLWPDCGEMGREGEFIYYEEEPVPIEMPQPHYPPGAVATRGGGKVVLHAFVDPRGKVCFIRVIRSVPPFDPHVIEAAKRWIFRPATSNGSPVGVWVEIPFQVPEQ